VITAIAALYRYLRRPFAVLLDELEQFTRYDTAQRTRRNITWLKRLLEQLAGAGALTFVAGHRSAWEVEQDYLDRFSQQFAMDLPVMSAAEVLQLAQAFVGRTGEFSAENAGEVARVSGGNMRRTLALLHQLYSTSDGFTRRLPVGAVATTARGLTARVEPERALARVEEVLAGLGLTVRRSSVIPPGLVFDLVAARGDIPLVAVDLKHATYQVGQYDQLRRFIERLRQARRRGPGIVGCFIADGAVDERLNDLISAAEVPVLLFNLADPDFAQQIGTEVGRQLKAHESRSAAEAGGSLRGAAEREDSAMSALLSELEKVKESQVALLNQVQDRLSEQGASGEAIAQAARLGDSRDQLTKLYEQATRPVGPSQLLAVTLSGFRGLVPIVLIILGITGQFAATPLAQTFFPYSSFGTGYNTAQLIFLLVAIGMLCVGAPVVVLDYISAVKYYRLRDRVLYGLYVQEVPASLMAETGQAFNSSIEEFGPVRGRKAVNEFLRSRGLSPDWGYGPAASPPATSIPPMKSYLPPEE
jgi:hypothetical protein